MPPKKLPPRLTAEEVAALVAIPNRRYKTGARNRALIRFLYRTGLRCAEALAVRRRNLDLDLMQVTVIDGKGKKDRVVPFDSTTAEIIQGWLDVKPRSDYVFCTLTGGQVKDAYVREMLARYGAKAGIEIRCRPHLLRHTFASEFLEQGGTIIELQYLLGHSDPKTTMIYTHVSNARLRKWLNSRPG
jgi:integrase/recombinase XerD